MKKLLMIAVILCSMSAIQGWSWSLGKSDGSPCSGPKSTECRSNSSCQLDNLGIRSRYVCKPIQSANPADTFGWE